MKQNNQHKTTHFGFQEVEEASKQGLVREVFAKVAPNYDLMNDAMSMGLHRAWKDQLIDQLQPTPQMHLLDVAGGTGDIAFRALKSGCAQVTLCDINPAMLAEGRRRALDANLQKNISWITGNAECLPCPSNKFDAYTIAFGIRNVTHIENALADAFRCLRVGGHFLCLEFSLPQNPILRKIYDKYSFNIIPSLGKLLSNDAESYQYLVESIRRFPHAEDFANMIKNAGFQQVNYKRLSGGIVCIHSGWKC